MGKVAIKAAVKGMKLSKKSVKDYEKTTETGKKHLRRLSGRDSNRQRRGRVEGICHSA